MNSVSFTVNVCSADAPFAEKTIRHMVRSLGYPFLERIAILDKGKPEGKYNARQGSDLDQILASLQKLMDEGSIDRVIEVPWEEDQIKRIAQKYFSNPDMPLRDIDGAPIYQYLYGLESCRGEYLLHADSDMLFHRGKPPSWIDQGIELLEAKEHVVFVTCGSPPKAKNRIERNVGIKFRAPRRRWRYMQNISTRKFLTSRKKLEGFLRPLLVGGKGEALEDSFTSTCKGRSLWRADLDFRFGWAVHPLRHNRTFVDHLDSFINLVEQGRFPFVRSGNYYDLVTEDGGAQAWLELMSPGSEV